MITVFTPTYNRAKTLPRLFQSLKQQDCKDFEWLVINDGSNDSTDSLLKKWVQDNNGFPIIYIQTSNGGKQRAINKALEIANGEFFFIVDSDDLLVPNAISIINNCFNTLTNADLFIGISGLKADFNRKPLKGIPRIDPSIGYVDCSNIERNKYGLLADMAEVFFTEKLRHYSFPVWEGENFTPESVVWDRIALDGYIIRWFNKIIYLCEYLPDGLTNSTWTLLADNPMGYAMMFNTKLKYKKTFKEKINNTLQFISCCCLAKEYKYIMNCHLKIWALVLLPAGFILSYRRKIQIQKYT